MTQPAFSGKRLRAIREREKMTQAKLAIRVDVPAPYVCNWETGRNTPRADNIIRLCRALRCGLEDLCE